MRTKLKTGETRLLVIRQHWIKLVLPIAVWVIVAILLIIGKWFGLGTSLIILMVVALYPLLVYVDWRFNLWCVTNYRVVDESGFLSRSSKESPLDKINNVEYHQSVWGRMSDGIDAKTTKTSINAFSSGQSDQ